MKDVVVVGKLERRAQVWDECESLLGREASGLHCLAEIDPFHILHEQVIVATALAIIMDADNVRMAEFRKCQGFLRKPHGKARIGAEFG